MKKIKIYLVTIIILFGNIFSLINYKVIKTGSEYISESWSDVDAILILGAGIKDGKPSLMLQERLDKGLELYNSKVSDKILVSGDHGNLNYDEVNIMRDYLIEKGVPSSDIFMDHAGFSTYESIYRAKVIFEIKRVAIVTEKYHLYRALYLMKEFGLDGYGVDATKQIYYGQTKRNIRENLARIKDYFYGVFKPSPKYLGEVIPINGNGEITIDKGDRDE